MDHLTQLVDFFLDLCDHVRGGDPVEADGGGARAELKCAQQRRQGSWNAAQDRFLDGSRGPTLAGLEILPLLNDRPAVSCSRASARGRPSAVKTCG